MLLLIISIMLTPLHINRIQRDSVAIPPKDYNQTDMVRIGGLSLPHCHGGGGPWSGGLDRQSLENEGGRGTPNAT